MIAGLADIGVRMRRNPGWGCLAPDCETVEASCPAITRHMQAAHPELGIEDCHYECPEVTV